MTNIPFVIGLDLRKEKNADEDSANVGIRWRYVSVSGRELARTWVVGRSDGGKRAAVDPSRSMGPHPSEHGDSCAGSVFTLATGADPLWKPKQQRIAVGQSQPSDLPLMIITRCGGPRGRLGGGGRRVMSDGESTVKL
ncbi:hypothetical protein BHE74_00029802 [Ensete ventricosum]|nr:hypothetical protein BHE74_00029802 [Ensete ventricosum]